MQNYMYIELRLGVACTSYSDQVLVASKNVLEHFSTFTQTVDKKPLTYDMAVLEMDKGAKLIQARLWTPIAS